jgi:hypothetical protein
MAGRHYVYIAKCADGTLYTGYTVDITERERAHNSELARNIPGHAGLLNSGRKKGINAKKANARLKETKNVRTQVPNKNSRAAA